MLVISGSFEMVFFLDYHSHIFCENLKMMLVKRETNSLLLEEMVQMNFERKNIVHDRFCCFIVCHRDI